jgi:peptidoglycan/xylan/chitin deacetylase (PgdA/CDA1 family)
MRNITIVGVGGAFAICLSVIGFALGSGFQASEAQGGATTAIAAEKSPTRARAESTLAPSPWPQATIQLPTTGGDQPLFTAALAASSLPQPAPSAAPACKNPNALGVSRVVEINTTGGPGFGFEHFRQHDFLHDKEVVLTFDDGPWPTTDAVLQALANECVNATFFAIGKHATYYPAILRSVAAGGHSIGSHTWSHQDLTKKSSEEAKAEIEKAISAVQLALGDQPQASFFRFPALRHPPEMVTYLGERNIAIFSADLDSFDFKLRKPEQIVKGIMAKLEKHHKGIVLMHDFQPATSHALPQLLAELKAGGYKIVHMKSHSAARTLPLFDDEVRKDQKLPTISQRSTSNIVREIQ